MIAGMPPPWQSTPPAQKLAPLTTPLARAVRWLPAALLGYVCVCSAACVVLLVLLPTSGLAAPLGRTGSLPWVSPVGGCCLLAAYALLWALAIASAVTAVRVPPGHIPLWLYSREPGDQAYFHNVLQAVEKKLDGSLRFCRKCGAFKPDLSHHCRQLGLCILCYQHWDLWANNAIGFYNYKAYLLALFYGALAHAAGAMLLLPFAAATLHGGTTDPLGAAAALDLHVAVLGLLAGGDASVPAFGALTLTASVLLGGGCALWLLFHAALIAAGSTAHTCFRQGGCLRQKPPKQPIPGQPFDFGPRGNFGRACGRHPLLWLLPTNQGVEGNGIFFELRGTDEPWSRYK